MNRADAFPAVSAGLIEQLREIVGDAGLLTGGEVAGRYPGYFMDRIGADAIVRPRTTDEVAAILRLCSAAGQPVVVHGGMSGWVRATETRRGEIALSLERMAAIETIDPVNRTATVQAGVILETLETELAEHGLTFPLDLGGRGSCQLGGNASTNAGGMRVIRYGMMREQVLGVEAVLADGRVISSLNQMIKNNTGYDLKQLFIGSEGTLGVITRLVLRLRERPTSSNTAIVCAANFDQMVNLLRFVDQGFGGLLSAFELIDNSFYRVNTGAGKHAPPLSADQPYYAIIEMLGSQQERDTELFETVLGEAGERGYFDDAVLARSEAQRQQIWEIREDLEHVVREFQPFYAFDVSLPVGKMQDYIAAVTGRLKTRWPDGKIAFLGHMGDGNLHIAIGAGEEGDRHHVEECVYEPLRPIGGSISAEHGIGLEKKPWLDVSRSAGERGLMAEIKRLLDPGNILNPGKIMDVRT
ncbi:FAD-binding oxidoreductase [Sphingopyxis sp.]|uniref:FAD-binding oxidoreductase n=1 Tax=Sphingopyxis sp. TaxID=1908224 RepID=UPI002D77D753|nr:FAD-binding oxidoreductase [Sphingopyxis sp.]HET6526386.1 FAD-binding oxidoreductase [Sphingopyxis sp.]